MKNIITSIILTLFIPSVVLGYTLLYPNGGGTGTGSIPTYGQVLVGQSNGTYAPQATSTLGITTSGVTSISTTFPITGGTITNTGTIGFNGLSTSTAAVIGNIPYFSGVNTFANVATSSLSASSPLTGSFTVIGSGGSVGCQTASGSQAGCLSSVDWTTFNGKQNASSSPTVGYITATTTASSTFAGGVDAARVCLQGTTTCLGTSSGTASTTLLGDNNTFSGTNTFSKTISLATTTITGFSPMLLLASSSLSTANATVTASITTRADIRKIIVFTPNVTANNEIDMIFNKDQTTHYTDQQNGSSAAIVLVASNVALASSTSQLDVTTMSGQVTGTIGESIHMTTPGNGINVLTIGGFWGNSSAINAVDVFAKSGGTLGAGSFINIYGIPY